MVKKTQTTHAFLVNAIYKLLKLLMWTALNRVVSSGFVTPLISFFHFKKFWNICPMDHLLTRLAVDSRPVSRRIVNLLFDSFFPINQPKDVWCERCVTLIQMNSAAARKFYQYAYEYTAPTNIGKVLNSVGLWQCKYQTMEFF